MKVEGHAGNRNHIERQHRGGNRDPKKNATYATAMSSAQEDVMRGDIRSAPWVQGLQDSDTRRRVPTAAQPNGMMDRSPRL